MPLDSEVLQECKEQNSCTLHSVETEYLPYNLLSQSAPCHEL